MSTTTKRRMTRNSNGGRNFCSRDTGLGVNLRVTMCVDKGSRPHMEDRLVFSTLPTRDGKDISVAYFGVFDGHGGSEAAEYAKTHLMEHITCQEKFWSFEDEDVLSAISDGFIAAHDGMRNEMDQWSTGNNFLHNISTAGTTASIAFIMRGKIFTGHVGDSRIVLGRTDKKLAEQFGPNVWKADALSKDHTPSCPLEKERIEKNGGKVKQKKGVDRVVWKRKKYEILDESDSSADPVISGKSSNKFEEVPFLAVARSLGDFWSRNEETGVYSVSPYPDISVTKLELDTHRCLLLATDGVWNFLDSQQAINSVACATKLSLECRGAMDLDQNEIERMNPSRRIVRRIKDSLRDRCKKTDNISVMTITFEPPGLADDELDEIIFIQPTSFIEPEPVCIEPKRTYLIVSNDPSSPALSSILKPATRISRFKEGGNNTPTPKSKFAKPRRRKSRKLS